MSGNFAWKFGFWISSWLIIALSGILTPNPLDNLYIQGFLVALGIAAMIYGLLLNAVAGKTLKKYGHFDIKRGIEKPDRLVTTGIYSCMRHPAQFGSIFFGIGIALLTTNLLALMVAGWFSFFALYFILAVEERETVQEFGEEYCQFLAERKPFTFSFRCLRAGIRALKNDRVK